MASNGVFGLIHVLLDFSGAHKVLMLFIVLESGKFYSIYINNSLSPYIQKEKRCGSKETVNGLSQIKLSLKKLQQHP